MLASDRTWAIDRLDPMAVAHALHETRVCFSRKTCKACKAWEVTERVPTVNAGVRRSVLARDRPLAVRLRRRLPEPILRHTPHQNLVRSMWSMRSMDAPSGRRRVTLRHTPHEILVVSMKSMVSMDVITGPGRPPAGLRGPARSVPGTRSPGEAGRGGELTAVGRYPRPDPTPAGWKGVGNPAWCASWLDSARSDRPDRSSGPAAVGARPPAGGR
jgi:hypothetical protein